MFKHKKIKGEKNPETFLFPEFFPGKSTHSLGFQLVSLLLVRLDEQGEGGNWKQSEKLVSWPVSSLSRVSGSCLHLDSCPSSWQKLRDPPGGCDLRGYCPARDGIRGGEEMAEEEALGQNL